MAGRIQNEDVKSAAELVSAGATAASLPNDDKIYVTASGINKTLKQAIIDGDIGGGGALVVTGTRGSPNNIVAGTGVVYVQSAGKRQAWFVATASGEVTLTATPQITAGTVVGYELWLIGTSNDNYPTFHDGNGMALRGDWSGLLNSILQLMWDGSNWLETGRI